MQTGTCGNTAPEIRWIEESLDFIESANPKVKHLASSSISFSCGAVKEAVQAVLQAEPKAEGAPQVQPSHRAHHLSSFLGSLNILIHLPQADQVQVVVDNLHR